MVDSEKKMRKVAVLDPALGVWDHRSIEAGLEHLQELVGGWIEAVPLEVEDATLYLNEEGKLLGLPPSAHWIYEGEVVDVLCGTLVALGPKDEEGYTTDLTVEAFASIQRQVRPLGQGVGTIMPTPEPVYHVFSWDI